MKKYRVAHASILCAPMCPARVIGVADTQIQRSLVSSVRLDTVILLNLHDISHIVWFLAILFGTIIVYIFYFYRTI